MPLPGQTFSTIELLLTYINTYVIPNGQEEITGEIDNNVMNALANFIKSYTVNNSLARLISTGGVVVLPKPVTIITTVVPTSLQWDDNVQSEYYIVNTLGSDIPLASGFVYYDEYLTANTVIPARSVIHIAKAENQNWMQVNNIPTASILPPQTGNQGRVLTTNGSTASWTDNVLYIKSADFESDGVTYLNSDLVNNKFDLFFDTLAGFIYSEDLQWQYVTAGGFTILIPGIDANTQDIRIHLFKRGKNSNH